MQNTITPKAQNANKGYYFDVTDNEIQEHLQRSVEDIFAWLENTNKFIAQIQTPTEKLHTNLAKSAAILN
ncbi:hypothetical protein V6R21_14430 [Limibacter armeniacum]|uniref:hypothetical protein n=1 Tax=Limibacter armeniacum TaxID=466084 RepID=UPI002FE57B1E